MQMYQLKAIGMKWTYRMDYSTDLLYNVHVWSIYFEIIVVLKKLQYPFKL